MSAEQNSQATTLGTSQKTFSVLLIDDEPDTLTVQKKSLEFNGMRTYGFTNPVLAVEHFKQNPGSYDLVVTDIRMPNMNGFEVTRALRKINPEIKVAFSTSFEINRSEFERILPSSKIDAFITKPITPKKFAEVIRGILQGRQKESLDVLRVS